MQRLTALAIILAACKLASAQDDLADVRSKKYRLSDRKLEYVLIGAKERRETPPSGYRLLVVLPGGDGSSEFTPFVKRIFKHALSDAYLVVQPIAPKWNPRQEVTWPTERLPAKRMRISTEEFISLAVVDVSGRTRVDTQHVFVFGWSSGGPAAYAAGLAEDTPITGVYAAMSVFKPRLLPDLATAKQRAFYILHSEEDRVCPIRMARDAEQRLGENGAIVKLQTYAGGHGWQGNVYGNLAAGVNWLEQQVAVSAEGN